MAESRIPKPGPLTRINPRSAQDLASSRLQKPSGYIETIPTGIPKPSGPVALPHRPPGSRIPLTPTLSKALAPSSGQLWKKFKAIKAHSQTLKRSPSAEITTVRTFDIDGPYVDGPYVIPRNDMVKPTSQTIPRLPRQRVEN